MSDKNSSSEAVREILRRYDGRFTPFFSDAPSPDEVAAFLDAASQLPPGQLKRLVAAVREALADERDHDGLRA